MKEKITLYRSDLIEVVADGAISSPVIEGGPMIPVVIVDARNHPTLVELVAIHEGLPPGDVNSTWISTDEKEFVLSLNFIRPVKLHIAIDFDIRRRAMLVDAVMTQKCMYLQPGQPGDRLSDNPIAPKIIVEVTASGYEKRWNKVYSKLMCSRFRSAGSKRWDAKREARTAIEDWRKMMRMRRPLFDNTDGIS